MTRPSHAVVIAVADASNVPAKDLTPPLNRVVDPEALDKLVDSTSDSIEASLTIRFEYIGHDVVVHDDGTIELDGREVDTNA